MIRTLLGKTPRFGTNTFLSETSCIIGDVIAGDDCSFWYNCVIRADVSPIRIGNRVNIQDNVTVHGTYQRTKTIIGNNVSIGHNAIVHGANVHDDVLIGMGAIVMDNCVIEENSIIASGAVLAQGTIVKSGSIYAGIPAKKIKDISIQLTKGEIKRIAENYIQYASWYQD